jgi:TRAP-type C4-dicarboxylate transport system substrate-binding protein
MARRMRIGQLQGALLSVVGLREIEPSISALQNMPLLFRSWDEVDYVREKMRPAMRRNFSTRASWCSPGATPAGCASSRRSPRCARTTTAR